MREQIGHVNVMVMSGVEDGSLHTINLEDLVDHQIYIGRSQENEIVIQTDAAISRQHAILKLDGANWWLIDCDSKNGTYVERKNVLERDQRVKDRIQIDIGQLFRVGKTWLRIQYDE